MSHFSNDLHQRRYDSLQAILESRELDINHVKTALAELAIELPSWGFGNSGTRFGVFRQVGAARTLAERMQDAAKVHELTGQCPSIAIHIPWDKSDDYASMKALAADLGIRIGAVNPNVFQDQVYKYGSLANPSPGIRRRAFEHHLECIEIMRKVDSNIISLWYADGTNYPGQDHIIERKHRFEEAFAKLHAALPPEACMLIEYKPFEPAFYHTDIADWGMAYNFAVKAGERAKVLVDVGHHLPGANIEHIVANLIDEGRLGGFHFNNRKYADDDLTLGSVNPYEIFLIFREVLQNGGQNIAYMVDQSHNIKLKIPAMLQTVKQAQRLYAKALTVDTQALRKAQQNADVVSAENCLLDAFYTDVDPLIERLHIESGRNPDPLQGYADSGYQSQIETTRSGAIDGAGGWG